ncbi:hypothetical protein A6R68_16581 [Neotoma lepida]|uniref:Uncharacterized protein n=1 Tax=Neotoma lepida TaxID=56216 RepID=A0A1A6HH49_NEOLE|nr:hypothetical protein A6R68_16581 [Neotoma lepida]
MALEVTYLKQLRRTCKEVKSPLDYPISVQDMMCCKWQEHTIDRVETHVDRIQLLLTLLSQHRGSADLDWALGPL